MRQLILIFLSLILMVNEAAASVYEGKREIPVIESKPMIQSYYDREVDMSDGFHEEREKLFGPLPLWKGFGYEILPEHEGEDFIPRVLQRDE